jgi:hypothetical protein
MQNHDTTTTELLQELYRIDPELRRYEADLPNLITTLTKHRPNVDIDETFVHNLRASLLNQADTPPAKNTTPRSIPSPFIWWVTRLSPVGIALVVIITLLPNTTIAPNPEPSGSGPGLATEVPTATQKVELFSTAAPDETSTLSTMDAATMSKLAAPQSFQVEPPLSGTSVTITSITLPEAGWVVVYTDDGGAFGTVLGKIYLESGLHTEVTIPLTQALTYPGMITVVAYTGANATTFTAQNEMIQIDSMTGTAMTITVPVVSELELGLPQ